MFAESQEHSVCIDALHDAAAYYGLAQTTMLPTELADSLRCIVHQHVYSKIARAGFVVMALFFSRYAIAAFLGVAGFRVHYFMVVD